MAEKKARDYTNSAVNLCNPPKLRDLLADLALHKKAKASLQAQLEKTQLYTELGNRQDDITACEDTIRVAIVTHGSYQDLVKGDYAIQQRKVTITYVASRVREFLRGYSDAVIEEVVSKPKLEGLRKGGLVSQADLDRCANTIETFSYIIQVKEGK